MGKSKYTVNAKTLALDLLGCKKAFDSAGVPWIITDGVVLGYARHNSIMEWDTDLDFAVFVEINSRRWKLLYNAFLKEGFRIGSKKSDFLCGGRSTPFNLWFFHKKGNFYESFPKTTPNIKFVEKEVWFDKPNMVDFLGSKYPMPNNTNDYLDYHYGKDWKTNIIKNHDEWFKTKRGGDGKKESQPLWLGGRSGKDGDLWPKILKIKDDIKDLS